MTALTARHITDAATTYASVTLTIAGAGHADEAPRSPAPDTTHDRDGCDWCLAPAVVKVEFTGPAVDW